MTNREFVGVCFLAALLVATPGSAFKRTQVGDPLKDFSLPSAAETEVTLSKSLGRSATLVVFWATWSPRSAEALEDFQKLYEEYRGEGLQVLAVSVEHEDWGADDAANITSFAQEHRLTIPIAFDEDLSVFNAYGVIAVPSMALLGPDGKVLDLLEGYSHMTRVGFRERVLLALGVRPSTPQVEAHEVGRRPAGKAARYLQMGELLLERQMPSKAERAFRQALAEDPEWDEAYRWLAAALEVQGKTEEADGARERAKTLKADSNDGRAVSVQESARGASTEKNLGAVRHLRMGALLLHEGMLSAAETAFRKAIEEAPTSPEAYRKLAEALDAQGKGEEAGSVRARAVTMELGVGASGTSDHRQE